ncbi:MAG: SHOCT domain-containing protein [Caldilineaceae bacterium]|nr:SHOCT domain-containing protein [Caldilineaceae bacterium]
MRRRRGVNVNVNTRRGPGLVGTMARTAVIAGTATAAVGATKAVMGGGSKQAAQQQAAADQQQQAVDQAAQQAYDAGQQDALAQQAAAAPASDDFSQQLVQIQQLSALKDQGLLTEEEFAAKKSQILGI